MTQYFYSPAFLPSFPLLLHLISSLLLPSTQPPPHDDLFSLRRDSQAENDFPSSSFQFLPVWQLLSFLSPPTSTNFHSIHYTLIRLIKRSPKKKSKNPSSFNYKTTTSNLSTKQLTTQSYNRLTYG